MPGPTPTIIGIGGFESNTGKTSLMCELLRMFPGWEAIKTTRGHYRSCGRDPQTCCVSHLLGDHPVIRSGREETYVPGKDTGRYWDAGATNVHWVIATEEQVGKGILDALKLVRTDGVFIEGNSFSEYVDVDLMIMVASAAGEQIKKSARLALARSAVLFVSGGTTLKAEPVEQERFEKWLRTSSRVSYASSLPIYSWADLPQLVAEVQRVSSSMPGNPDKIWASKVGQSNTAS